MAYFAREDIPFQYALAEAFTLCDAYFCSMHISTNPNRLYIWTGAHDPMGRGNGPALNNDYDGWKDPDKHGGYAWTTYPERLMDAGVSFQIYQDMADNFSDNPLVGFRRYRAARGATSGPDLELARRTITTRHLDLLKEDVRTGRLPQVSWIIAPTVWSEHPSVSTPLQGAEYTAQVLDALTANPDVWSRTVLLINFDENDGLFDHVPPPAPPARDPGDPHRLIGATTVPAEEEYHRLVRGDSDAAYRNRPYGLGVRVPLYAVSPWSRGGYVASEVFDHTSVIRFLEKRFGVHEPNISAWRRAVCGDLTSCFDFTAPDNRSFLGQLPPTRALAQKAAMLEETPPVLPSALKAPVQETGLRRRRPTPYRLTAALSIGGGKPCIEMRNLAGSGAAVFHLYRPAHLDKVPERYTVGAGHRLAAPLAHADDRDHDIFLSGPAGFHRRFTGRALLLIVEEHIHGGKANLLLRNLLSASQTVSMRDMSYGLPAQHLTLAPGEGRSVGVDLGASHGWYDLLIEGEGNSVRLAGHDEDGQASFSDPAVGRADVLTIDIR